MESTNKIFILTSVLSFCICTILLFPIVSWAACTGSSPNWSTSADYASVNTCVSGASAGDTITVTGNATWTGNRLVITRGINLIGSGSPVITCKGIAIHWPIDAAARAAHDTLKIQGFIIDGNEATSGDCLGGGLITVTNGSGSDYVTLIVDKNTLKNTQARAFYVAGYVKGVAASNTLDRIGIPLTVGGYGYASWSSLTPSHGDDTAFYFEGNTMQYSSLTTPYAGFVESSNGARVVVRYNTWNQTNAAMDSMWDIHGLQAMRDATGKDFDCGGEGHPVCDATIKSCDNYSTMNAEYYGNEILNMTAQKLWMGQRGGQMLMFYNKYATSSKDTWISYGQYSCDNCAEKGSYTQHVNNTYLWNNFSNSNRVGMIKGMDLCADRTTGSPYIITENKDYWNFSTSFDGTTGMGCGTLASRPATCTIGVGYWATNQSCSELTGMVGAAPTTPISGTLYKCTATDTWTAYYTPYTYPHPLSPKGGGIVPPTGIRVTNS